MRHNEEENHRKIFEQMVIATNVQGVWPLEELVQTTPPSFDVDYDLAYSLLATMVAAELRYAQPVYINKSGVGKVFGVDRQTIDDYMGWFCDMGLLRKY